MFLVKKQPIANTLSSIQKVARAGDGFIVISGERNDSRGFGIIEIVTRSSDSEILETCNADVMDDFECCVSYESLLRVVSNLAKNDVLNCDVVPEVSDDDTEDIKSVLSIHVDKMQYKVPAGTETEYYTSPNEGKSIPVFSISKDNLIHHLDKTMFGMSNEKTRIFLNGVRFEIRGDVITTVATDGRFIACCTTYADETFTDEFDFTIPRDNINQCYKTLKNVDTENFFFYYKDNSDEDFRSKNNLIIEHDRGYIDLSTDFDQYSFPEWRHLMLSEKPFYGVLDKKELADIIKKVSTIVKNKIESHAQVYIDIKDGATHIHGSQRDDGVTISSTTETIECRLSSQVDENELLFNVNYLSKCVNQIGSDKIGIAYTDSISDGVLLLPVDDPDRFHHVFGDSGVNFKRIDDTTYQTMLMPIRKDD